MLATDPILTATDLRKRFRRTWALQGIDLAIPPGRITALVGPNAAGKSTLIRTWLGFERPTSGSTSVCGFDPATEPGCVIARIGYVPQSPSLYEALTVADHLLLAEQLRPGFDRRGAEGRLATLAIPLDRRGKELSGGQQAQVALALALGVDAEVLLLDEPLSDLDPLARREFLQVMGDAVRDRGTSVLLSSHIVSDVEQSCDALVVLGVGRVLLHATIAEVMDGFLVGPGHAATSGQAVASFAGSAGEPLVLLRRDTDGAANSLRAATLEEVVIGHLASARIDMGRAA